MGPSSKPILTSAFPVVTAINRSRRTSSRGVAQFRAFDGGGTPNLPSARRVETEYIWVPLPFPCHSVPIQIDLSLIYEPTRAQQSGADFCQRPASTEGSGLSLRGGISNSEWQG